MLTKVVDTTIAEMLGVIWLEMAFLGWNFTCEHISGPNVRLTWTYNEPRELLGLQGIIDAAD